MRHPRHGRGGHPLLPRPRVTPPAILLSARTHERRLCPVPHIDAAAKRGGDERVRVRVIREAEGQHERQVGTRAEPRPLAEPPRVGPRQIDAADRARRARAAWSRLVPPILSF